MEACRFCWIALRILYIALRVKFVDEDRSAMNKRNHRIIKVEVKGAAHATDLSFRIRSSY